MTQKLLRNGELAQACDTVALSDYLADPEAWSNIDPAAWSVVIAPEDDLSNVPQLLLELPALYLAFPVYTDGRGYSHARTLRMHHRYVGELVAVGDIRRDQVESMRRVGIETVEFTGRHSVVDMITAMHELDMSEQHNFYSGGAITNVG